MQFYGTLILNIFYSNGAKSARAYGLYVYMHSLLYLTESVQGRSMHFILVLFFQLKHSFGSFMLFSVQFTLENIKSIFNVRRSMHLPYASVMSNTSFFDVCDNVVVRSIPAYLWRDSHFDAVLKIQSYYLLNI